MGTNYYWIHRENVCSKCRRADEIRLHIGKSSMGWCFSLHVYPTEEDHHEGCRPKEPIKNLEGWEKMFAIEGSHIENEDSVVITPEEMVNIITRKLMPLRTIGQKPYGYSSWGAFHEENDSQLGPKGLLRHRRSHYCIGHGEGAWDLLIGDFS